MKATLTVLLLALCVGYSQAEQRDAPLSLALLITTAQDEDSELLNRLRVIVEREREITSSLQQLCRKHGFSVLRSPSRKDVAYILSNRILRSSAAAFQQVFQSLETGKPIDLARNSPVYESLKLALRANEFVRIGDLDALLQRHDYASIMLSGEIVATITVNGDTYRLDVGQLYRVSKNMFPSEGQPGVDTPKKQTDAPQEVSDTKWSVHFIGLLPPTDKERSETVIEAFTLIQQSTESDMQMYQQVIQSAIQRMGQEFRERESLEVEHPYSVEKLPEQWQAVLRQAAAENGWKWESIRNAQVQFAIAPGLQFLLQAGDNRRVLGFRLTETRVFSYLVDSVNGAGEN